MRCPPMFESNQSGIETLNIARDVLLEIVSLNRTRVELKHDQSAPRERRSIGLNRTRVELKP